ncbi:hypothetical protein LTR24_002535 [Lithohypha guttulata]|uniref:AB hydrolase-1 domain-containing protein n=1 Tax=Lithohypha guttulata TaxID=1690604 RepID=A0ABR0KHQ9_9EURO|nr:hypothetical protein LTR24_002535 [Lithohypha guttulata]
MSSPEALNVTFVLVPGSFTIPAEYDKVEGLLKDRGHKVKPVSLLSANDGTRMPPATVEEDTAHIREELLSVLDAQRHNVVMCVHSYSGVPGSSALRGLSKPDRLAAGKDTSVLGIVYVGSFLPVVGQSLRDILGEAMPEPYKTGFPGEYMPAISSEMAAFIFNDVEDQSEMAKYYAMMTRHSSNSYGGKCTYAAWMDVQSVQIIPEKDVILPVHVQEAMYERAVKDGGKVKRVFLEGAGHCPNVSRPQLVVDELVGLVQA